MIEQHHACSCCKLFKNCYFQHFDVTIPTDYFTYNHGTGYFVNNTELINHLSVQLHPKINDDLNRYHQFFYIWLLKKWMKGLHRDFSCWRGDS